MARRITEDTPGVGSRSFTIHDLDSRTRLLVTSTAIPAAPLLNGQVADILIVLAACLGRSCPPGIKLTDHTIHDKVRSASLAFEDQAGWAHVALYHQDDVSFDGEAPEWETFTVAPVSLVIPALALLAAHLTVFRHLNHLPADPGQ